MLSPLLWGVFFNNTVRGLTDRGGKPAGHRARRLELVYADDVTALASAETLVEVRIEAHGIVDMLRNLLKSQGLKLNNTKTHNMLFDPYFLPKGIFKRTNRLNCPSTRQRHTTQYRLEGPETEQHWSSTLNPTNL